MNPFMWWVLPVAVTLIASCWAGWVRRDRPPPTTADSVAAYERFRAALRVDERPTVSTEPARDRTLS